MKTIAKILFGILLFFIHHQISGQCWFKIAQLPDHLTYTDIFFLDENKGWVVGDSSVIYHTADGGISWVKQFEVDNKISFKWNEIIFLNEERGFVVGERGFMLKTIDGGVNWEFITIFQYPIYFRNPFSGEVYRKYPDDYSDIDFLNDSVGWISTFNRETDFFELYRADPYLFKTVDGGESWHIVSEKNFSKVFFQSEEIGYAISRDSGAVFETLNGGALWESVLRFPSSLFQLNGLDYFAQLSPGTIISSIDSAGIIITHQLLIPQPFPQNNFTAAFIPSTPNDVTTTSRARWIVGDNGLIYTQTNRGWEPFYYAGNEDLVSLSFIGPTQGWALGEKGAIIQYTDNQQAPQLAVNLSWPIDSIPILDRLDTIHWLENTDCIEGYLLSLRTLSGLGDIFEMQDVGRERSYVLPSNLIYDTEYIVSIISYNRYDTSEVVQEYQFKTPPIPNRLSDSLALVALYTATNGNGWLQGWDLAEPFPSWYGIQTDTNFRVTALNLPNNQLLGAVPGVLGNLDQLQRLDFSHNNISLLSPSMNKLTRLKYLDLSHNPLSNIPEIFTFLNQLEFLNIEATRIGVNNPENLEANPSVLPNSIKDLSSMTSLDLSNNNLIQLPNWIGNLTNIHVLDLSENRLIELPGELDSLSQLRTLLLQNNTLSTLPDSLKNIDLLDSLNLSGNQITQIPKWIEQQTALNFLNLSNNQLDTLPPLSMTGQLFVANNKLTFDDILNNKPLFEGKAQTRYSPQAIIPVLESEFQFAPCDTPIIRIPWTDQTPNQQIIGFKELSNLSVRQEPQQFQLRLNDVANRLDYESYPGEYVFELSIPTSGIDLNLQTESVFVSTTHECLEESIRQVTICTGSSYFIETEGPTEEFNANRKLDCITVAGDQCDTVLTVMLDFYPTSSTINGSIQLGRQVQYGTQIYDCNRLSGSEVIVDTLTGCPLELIVNLSCEISVEAETFIPKVITPNETTNYTFIIPSIEQNPSIFSQNKLSIYNRYRKLVFEQNNYKNTWNGTDNNGNLLPSGSYFFKFEYNTIENIQGTITIIR